MSEAASFADTGPIDEVMAQAAREGLSSTVMLRLEALRWEFLARAAPEQYAQFRRYADAILPQNQFASGPAPSLTRVAPAMAPACKKVGEALPDAIVPPRPPWRAWTEQHARSLGTAAITLVLTLTVAIVWCRGEPSNEPMEPPLETDPSLIVPTRQPTDTIEPPPLPAMDWVFHPEPRWLLVVGAILLAGIGYLVWTRRRRRALRRTANETNQPLSPIAVRIGHNTLFSDPGLRQVLRNLRRHRASPSDRIDVPASIRATVAASGLPTIRFGKRPLTPEYLLVHEREAPADHLAELAVALAQRLDQTQIINCRYEFYGDPSMLRRASGKPADHFDSLETVLSLHQGARLMMLMESADVAEPGAVPAWLDTASTSSTPVLINPRPTEQWTVQERKLELAGLPSFAADPEGLARYADRLGRGTMANDGAATGAVHAPDLAAYLAQHRSMLLSCEPPSAERITATIDNLQRWLDAGAMDWLRTIALFPVINSGFTFFAGATLNEQSLITHERFLALARLPWLRTGQMPDWLRQALVTGFGLERLERATAVIHAYLMPPTGNVATRADVLRLRREANRPSQRAKLLARLAAMDNPFSDDPLMLGALSGTPPAQLDVAADVVSMRAVRWHERVAVRAGLATLIAMAMWTLLDPPFVQKSADVPPDDASSDAPAIEASAPPSETSDVATVTADPREQATSAVAVDMVQQPRLYIMVNDAVGRAVGSRLRKQLARFELGGQKLLLPTIEIRDSGPTQTQLRCFEDDACDNIGPLRDAIASAGVTAKVVVFRAKDFTWKSNARPNHYELWFAASAAASSGKAALRSSGKASPGVLPDKTAGSVSTVGANPPKPAASGKGTALRPLQSPVQTSGPSPVGASGSKSGRADETLVVPCEYLGASALQAHKYIIDDRLDAIIASATRQPPSEFLLSGAGGDKTMIMCRDYVATRLGVEIPGIRIIEQGRPTSTRTGLALEVTLVRNQTAQ